MTDLKDGPVLRALWLDDDVRLLAAIRELNASTPAQPVDIQTSSSPQEAIDLIEAGGVSFFICDLRLGPGKENGLAILQRVRAIKPDIKLALVTGYALDGEAAKLTKDLDLLVYEKASIDTNRILADISHVQPFEQSGVLNTNGAPLSPESPEYRQILTDVSAVNSELIARLRSDPKILWEISPRRFEEVIAELLGSQGYTITLTPASRDGGVDIFAARRDGLGNFLYLVECKRYIPPNSVVGVEIVRSMLGVLEAYRANGAAIVTSSFFTRGALEFQRTFEHRIKLHDFIEVQRWLSIFNKREF